MASNPVYKYLHSIKVSDVLPAERKEVITLTDSDSIEKAVKVLSTNKILSAPVLDSNKECIGFVDTLDILKFVVSAAPSDAELKSDELGSLKIADRAISLVALKDVIDLSGKDPMVAVYETNPASSLLNVFSQGFHRVALFNAEQQVVAICSQSDVARHLKDKIKQGDMKHIAHKSLKDLGYASAQVDAVQNTASVLVALKGLVKRGLGEAPLVDADGKLVGNFSASDLRGLYQQDFPHFLDSVESFLEKHSPKSLKPIVGHPSSELVEVLATLVDNHLHHVWVETDGKPTGIISLTDLMKVFVSEH